MIQGKSKTEANYRAIYLDSSSSLKDFSLDRKKYHKRYVLGETVEDADNKATVTGRVVETLLLEPEEFDNRFYMSACISAPTGLMLEFVNALYKHTTEATDDFGNVTREFEDIAKDAYIDSGFKIKFEAVVNKFVGSDAEIYYNEMRKVKAGGLTVVTTEDVANAEKIVNELRTNPVTANIVNLVNSARYEIRNQAQVEGYSVETHLFKSMMDKVVIDHEEKTIQVYDLKCVWAVEGFYEEYYLYRRAYIQAYLYYCAAEQIRAEDNYEKNDYKVLPPRFIVCDSTNYYNPLVYSLTHKDLIDAFEGFEHKGRKYTGVKELIEDLKWAQDNDIWNISRKNYLNDGVVNIRG
jgi:hypothetical protein